MFIPDFSSNEKTKGTRIDGNGKANCLQLVYKRKIAVLMAIKITVFCLANKNEK